MTETNNQSAEGLVPRLRFPEFVDDDTWAKFTLGSLLRIGSGRDYKHLSVGNVPVYGTGGYMCSVDDYLYNGESACIGRKGTIDNPLFLSGKFWTVDTLFYTYDFRGCTPKFVFLVFQKIDWQSYNEASGVPSLSKRTIEKIEIPVPQQNGTPMLVEQQKIADCLASLDDRIAAEIRQLDALKTHKQGLLQQLFPREGETVPRLRFSGCRQHGAWTIRKLDNIARRGSGHTPSKAHANYYNGGIKWISLADLQSLDRGLIERTRVDISDAGIQHSSAKLHPAGTVLTSRDASVGRSAVMGRAMAVSQHFITWTCDCKELSNWFLYYTLQVMKSVFERVATGSTIKTIGLPFFKELAIPIPPIGEQKEIADCLTSLDDLIAAQAKKIDLLKTHKRGLMQQLFPVLDEAA